MNNYGGKIFDFSLIMWQFGGIGAFAVNFGLAG